MASKSVAHRISAHLRSSAIAYLALFLALTMGTAYATHPGGQNTISTEDIIDAEIRSWDIRDNHVRTANLQNGAVNRDKLAKGAVVREKINNGAVNVDKLANGAVSEQKLANGAVTAAKLAFKPWTLDGNAGSDPANDFLGTTDDTPLDFRVDDQRALRIEPPGGTPNLIGGFAGNDVVAGARGATISGGGEWPPGIFSNRVTDNFGTIGGGHGNRAGDDAGTTSDRSYTTVAGGRSNTAGGLAATIAGGDGNTASAQFTAVGGGVGNTASGSQATVGGGQGNTASGAASVVAGGTANTAAGTGSVVAGVRAKNTDTDHGGVFLFADSSSVDDFTSAAANEFAVRASGGFRLRTSSNLSTGCNLPAGSGTFACTSDAGTKRDLEAISPRRVLGRLARLPIRTWRFAGEDRSVRHLGPTAQDFHRAFGLGSDRTSIGLPDANGVALAAIKGLARELRAERRLRHRLEARVAALERGRRR